MAKALTNSVETLKTPGSPTLQFKSDSGRYVLAQVWRENYFIGQQLMPLRSWMKTTKQQSASTQTVAARNSQ